MEHDQLLPESEKRMERGRKVKLDLFFHVFVGGAANQLFFGADISFSAKKP